MSWLGLGRVDWVLLYFFIIMNLGVEIVSRLLFLSVLVKRLFFS